MFFESWDNLWRAILLGSLAYAGTVVLLRVSGNRTLSKMNSFDLVITIAFGSTLSSILINKNVTLAQGLTAIALLVVLQFVVTWTSVRFRQFNRLIKTKPTLLLKDGNFLREAIKRTRITEDEIVSAVRQSGFGCVGRVFAVVLETDGSLSVIGKPQQGSGDALDGVAGGAPGEA